MHHRAAADARISHQAAREAAARAAAQAMQLEHRTAEAQAAQVSQQRLQQLAGRRAQQVGWCRGRRLEVWQVKQLPAWPRSCVMLCCAWLCIMLHYAWLCVMLRCAWLCVISCHLYLTWGLCQTSDEGVNQTGMCLLALYLHARTPPSQVHD